MIDSMIKREFITRIRKKTEVRSPLVMAIPRKEIRKTITKEKRKRAMLSKRG